MLARSTQQEKLQWLAAKEEERELKNVTERKRKGGRGVGEGKGDGCRGRQELGGRRRRGWGIERREGKEKDEVCTRLSVPGVPCCPGSGVREG